VKCKSFGGKVVGTILYRYYDGMNLSLENNGGKLYRIYTMVLILGIVVISIGGMDSFLYYGYLEIFVFMIILDAWMY